MQIMARMLVLVDPRFRAHREVALVFMQGSVFRARWRGTQVAVKLIHHESRGDSNLAVSREVMVGQVMSHPNLVGSYLMLLC